MCVLGQGGDPLIPGPSRQRRRRLSQNQSRCLCWHLLQFLGKTQAPCCSSTNSTTQVLRRRTKVDLYHFVPLTLGPHWLLTVSGVSITLLWHLHFHPLSSSVTSGFLRCCCMSLPFIANSCFWLLSISLMVLCSSLVYEGKIGCIHHRVLGGFDPDRLHTLKKEMVPSAVSCSIDAVVFTHQPIFLLNLIKLTRRPHEVPNLDVLLI